METIRLKKGLDLKIKGEATKKVLTTISPKVIALQPSNYKGVFPKLHVQEGDTVKAGQIIFSDKKREQICFTSPISGTIKAIVRGEKRKLLAIEIAPDGKNDYLTFEPISEVSKANRDEIQKRLLESGLWAGIIQRPYGIIANPTDTPKGIFISSFNTAPLAADLNFTTKDEVDAIQIAVDALCKFTDKIYVNVKADAPASPLSRLKNVVFTAFKGAHPAGNVGVQISHIAPIGKGDIVWTISPMTLIAMGKLFSKGIYDTQRLVAVTGQRVKEPAYVKCLPGTSIQSICEAFEIEKEVEICGQECGIRYISGNVLSGEDVGENGYLNFYDDQITLISEGNYRELFGWAKIFRPKKFSLSHTYFSWLTPKKKYKVDSNTNGGERPFVVNGVYEKVLPMDIYPVYLLKAILAQDIEKMEQLGIYEVIGEDLALCEYVCPSKINIQEIVENGINLMLKEMA